MANKQKIDEFIAIYEGKLKKAVKDYPALYKYRPERVPAIVQRVKESLATGAFSEIGVAMKATCEELQIPHTREAIAQFVGL